MAATVAGADKIKAEHMRTSSAMPALSPLKLDTKSSLLPAAAADAASAAADVAAKLPRSQTIAAPIIHGQAPASEPGLDARSKTGVCVCVCVCA